jgi:predicted Zn-dependent peptidase
MEHTRSVCVSVFVGAGSRYETEDEAGVSHFIEHLCFKGTQRRATAKEIAETIDGVGGLLNGGTDKEFTIYWCKVARNHFPLALDLLVDMIRHSRFDARDMEQERKIITEELNDSMDSPQDRVNRLIDEVIWPDQPLGREIIGNRETICALSRDMLLDYLGRRYGPDDTVVSIAGDIEHNEVLASAVDAFNDWPMATPGSPQPAVDYQDAPRVRIERRDAEQAHLCLAVRGLPIVHQDRFSLDILNVLLGGGMSSRLYIEIREKLGLAYDIHSYSEYYLDSGSVTIYAGVAPECVAEAIEAVIGELTLLKRGIPEEELLKAKELIKGRLLLSMEDTRNVANWAGAQEILLGQIQTIDEVVSIIDAIRVQDIERVAQHLFRTERLNAAIVGPVNSEDALIKLLKL